MAERTVICAWCKREFTAKRKDAVHCSRNCGNHSQRGPIPDRECLWCHTSMDGKRRGALYCCIQHKKNAAGARFRGRNPGYYKPYGRSDRMRKWLEDNRESRRAYARRYRQEHLEETTARSVEWRKANRTYFQVRERNRRASKINNPGSVGVSERDWLRMLRRYDYHCAYCGHRSDRTLEMDHVIPLSKGGRHAIGNVLPACHDCNLTKNAALLILWRYRQLCGAYDDLPGGMSA